MCRDSNDVTYTNYQLVKRRILKAYLPPVSFVTLESFQALVVDIGTQGSKSVFPESSPTQIWRANYLYVLVIVLFIGAEKLFLESSLVCEPTIESGRQSSLLFSNCELLATAPQSATGSYLFVQTRKHLKCIVDVLISFTLITCCF